MIKLTLNPDQEPEEVALDKEKIVIGRAGAENIDLPINAAEVQEKHVVIEEQDDRFIVINAANDPFTSLNGLPFGKKTLKNFDRIEIGSIKIQFEFIEEEASPTQIYALPENKVDEIDALLKEVEELSKSKPKQDKTTPPKNSENEIAGAAAVQPDELEQEEEEDDEPVSPAAKKYYLSDFDDESDQWVEGGFVSEAETNTAKKSLRDSWKLYAGFFLALIALCAVVFSGIYFRASGKNSQEEKKIAAGVADIAMAMTHAKLNHITPNKQNWSDPNFIRNNLARVLSPNLHTQAQIDSEGRFTKYPYRLRIYTSHHLDQFIIIAQPAPNLMQWLVHKKTIVLDSNDMEVRKITDLKALNRLLASTDPLEDHNGEEVHRLIKEGSLMSLNSLAGHKNHWGFSPPKSLGYIRPGADNYIYNAPRYYPFGEEFLRKAIELYQTTSSPGDVAEVQDEMDEISNFPSIVLYTSLGLQMAVEAQKALNTFAPNSKFLIAYVNFNPKGFVASSHLLTSDEMGEIALLQPPKVDLPFLTEENSPKQESDLLAIETEQNASFPSEQTDEDSTDLQHPIYLQLKASYNERKRVLQSISRRLVDLLNEQNDALHPDFETQFSEVYSDYLKTDRQFQQHIINEIGSLYQEHPDMPLEAFIKHVDKAKLSSFVNANLDDQFNTLGDQLLSDEEITEIFAKIDQAASFDELEHVVENAAGILTLNNLPNTELLIRSQELLRSHTLKRLRLFLLSPESPYVSTPVNENDRSLLFAIFENSWITDTNEKEYFLNEFDHLLTVQ